MSIVTRLTSLAAALAVTIGAGLAAAPAEAKNRNYPPVLSAQQVDRNDDGKISKKERRWAESLGYRQTNSGKWVMTDYNKYNKPGWVQTNDGKWVQTKPRGNGWVQTNDGKWVQTGYGQNYWNQNGWNQNYWNHNDLRPGGNGWVQTNDGVWVYRGSNDQGGRDHDRR